MPAYKDSKQGTWYASFYFENWQGVKQKKLKRGFATKKDALAWEREFLLQQAADLTMTFEAFVEIYITDKKKRLRENTWSTKEHIIRTKILPYFKEKGLNGFTKSNYRSAVQSRFNLSDGTMKYLDGHPTPDALYRKLATKG